jgi:hypothetical protein
VSVAGALSEAITVGIDHPADVFAAIGVINRPAGPILQAIGSTTQRSITVTAEIVVPAAKYGQSPPTAPVYNTFAKALSMIGSPNQIFLQSDKETFAERTGRYNRTTTFVWQ